MHRKPVMGLHVLPYGETYMSTERWRTRGGLSVFKTNHIMQSNLSRKTKLLILIEFLKGVLLMVVLVDMIVTVHVFWRCPNNKCVVTECTDILEGPTAEDPAICTNSETVTLPFRELLKRELIDWSTRAVFGLGLFAGAFMAGKKYDILKNK